MLIIPAIDILDGKVVRLSKGDYNKVTFYDKSPVEQAKLFFENGFKRIHLVDLMGSKTGNISVVDLIKKIKSQVAVEIELGGGVRTADDVKNLIANGVDKVIIGSMSVNNKSEFELAVKLVGANSIIVAADILNMKIAVKGWTEKTNLHLFDHIKYCSNLEITEYLCTDISKDGLLKGPNHKLYKNLVSSFSNANIIASGGVGSVQDLIELKKANVPSVVVGKAIYEGKITLEELKNIGS